MSNKEKNEISSIFLEDEIIEKKDTKKRKKKNQNFSTSEVVLLVILTCIVSLIMGYFVSFKLGDNKLSDDMKKFVSDFEDVVDNYYEKVDEKELLSNALKSVINSLDDPYSGAIDTSSSTNTELNGSYSGFGIEVINTEDKLIKIVNVIEDSPAQKAKLKSGDIIIKLDGESVEGMTVSDFSNKVKASKKQTMKIVVKRDNEELDISITREIIELKSVSGEILEKNNKKVAYIYISIFAANTHNQFKKLLTEFEKKGFDSLIIDVRDNTGGHLTSVENIISLFLNKNKVIYQIDDKGSISKYYSTGNKNVKYKIAVLINGISASASEMLAGTLSEQCNAILVGEKTFGKGTVQELRQADSDVQYKLTTKKWLTPKGVWIHGKGIEPNFKIELNDEYIKNPIKENDNQLNKALEELTK
jgi:carboxyl-terminal processing protease